MEIHPRETGLPTDSFTESHVIDPTGYGVNPQTGAVTSTHPIWAQSTVNRPIIPELGTNYHNDRTASLQARQIVDQSELPIMETKTTGKVLVVPSGIPNLGVDAIDELYTLVRLSNVEDGTGEEILEKLDRGIGEIHEVASTIELNDGSWEIVVLRLYLPTLQDKLSKIFPNSIVDLKYNPMEPSVDDVKYWGYGNAKALNTDWFSKRAGKMIKEAWPTASAYYSYLMGRCGQTRITCHL
ncbi:MAG: hypothetical protein M1834_000938 [Cirrosporium novae-zelandiae]|nr:MAG: hypothetical protein M1834_000938 [Cirrosporium novae-zelandiae]